MKKRNPTLETFRRRRAKKNQLRQQKRAPMLSAAGFNRKVGKRYRLIRLRRRAPKPPFGTARAAAWGERLYE